MASTGPDRAGSGSPEIPIPEIPDSEIPDFETYANG